jgi:hypothetical protein
MYATYLKVPDEDKYIPGKVRTDTLEEASSAINANTEDFSEGEHILVEIDRELPQSVFADDVYKLIYLGSRVEVCPGQDQNF